MASRDDPPPRTVAHPVASRSQSAVVLSGDDDVADGCCRVIAQRRFGAGIHDSGKDQVRARTSIECTDCFPVSATSTDDMPEAMSLSHAL